MRYDMKDMKTHTKFLFPASLFILLIGFVLTNSYQFGLCYSDVASQTFDVSCHSLFEHIGNQIYYGGGALALVFLVLLFVPQAFKAWKKFAVWFVPLATLLFIFYPEPGSGDLFAPYPETVYRWVSGAYVLLSLVIIAFASKVRK